jgi:predicted PolB exonuclease-like 3'-5' exonuclease
MQHQTLFVFDIETIPDVAAVDGLTGTDFESDQQRHSALLEYHNPDAPDQSVFVKPPFHKVVAISFLEAEISRDQDREYYELKEIRTGGKESSSEEELITGFFRYLERSRPRGVSYNGRGFDLPVLKYRAMKYGVDASWLFRSGDKWNSYMSRYSADWHCDLVDIFADYGASQRAKLNEVCAIFDFPGKIGVDGSQVYDLYQQKELSVIRNYCETDVLNTYLVYLRFQKLSGALTKTAYNQAIGDVLSYIQNADASQQHLMEFFQEWEKLCQGKFTIE